MKKRVLALAMLFVLVFLNAFFLISCGETEYEPVESTAEEKRAVINITYGGKNYEVAYELYRALFLELKSSVDGGNNDVWSGADKDTYIAKIDSLINERIAEIYSVFYLCEKEGIDVYSKDYDEKISEYIKVAVEGGTIDGELYEGFDGDYDKYLLSLKEMNLNYSVQTLLIRYQLAFEALAEHYMGSVSNDVYEAVQNGSIKYDEDTLKAFYFDENASRCVVSVLFSSENIKEERAFEIRESILKNKAKYDENSSSPAESENKLIGYMSGFVIGDPVQVLGKYTYDEFYYAELTDVAFSLDIGETSRVIMLKTDEFDGYAILHRVNTSEEFFTSNYDLIAEAYLYNEFGKITSEASELILSAATPTSFLNTLDRSSIKMN